MPVKDLRELRLVSSIYHFSLVALETGVDLNTVRCFLGAIEGGSNGLTMFKPLSQTK